MLDFSIRGAVATGRSLKLLAAIVAAQCFTIVVSGVTLGYAVMSIVVAGAGIHRYSETAQWGPDAGQWSPSKAGEEVSLWLQYADSYSATEILVHGSVVFSFVMAIFVIAATVYQWFRIHRGGGWAIGLAMGGRILESPADPSERQLVNIVEEISVAFATSPPAIVVLDHEPGINAFAAGLSSDDQIVCVTRGAIETLRRDEMQGIIAHEVGHLAAGDTKLGTIATAAIYGLRAIHHVASAMTRHGWQNLQTCWDDHQHGAADAIALLMIPVGILLWPIGITGAAVAHGLAVLMNQQRERLADATAVARTRHPESLASALRAIAMHPDKGRIRNHQSSLVAAMWFVAASGRDSRWGTHPPLADRILALDPDCDKVDRIRAHENRTTSDEQQLENAVATLLSLVANCDGEDSLSEYEFMSGWGWVSDRPATRQTIDEMTPESVESAIAIVGRCPPKEKLAFVKALETVIDADRVRSDEEIDLRRRLLDAIEA